MMTMDAWPFWVFGVANPIFLGGMMMWAAGCFDPRWWK